MFGELQLFSHSSSPGEGGGEGVEYADVEGESGGGKCGGCGGVEKTSGSVAAGE